MEGIRGFTEGIRGLAGSQELSPSSNTAFVTDKPSCVLSGCYLGAFWIVSGCCGRLKVDAERSDQRRIIKDDTIGI